MFLSKPVVGTKQLRSLAGSLSFIAGIIPPMRPFLSALWAVLGSANDGSKTSGKLIHTKRIASALEWILSVLVNFSQRTLWVHRPESHAVIVTDASTHGLGAVTYIRGSRKNTSAPFRPCSCTGSTHRRGILNSCVCGNLFVY